ncbi:MAG: hypothetical protein EOL91_13300 [Actinobacteria bacterium]|nr:hypothetical protein [Actinomycetota bacterium]
MRTMNDTEDPRRHPLDALAQLARRRRDLDAEEYHRVLEARAAGASWQGIAAALGVSRQAAHKKFRGRGPA